MHFLNRIGLGFRLVLGRITHLLHKNLLLELFRIKNHILFMTATVIY